ncbi:MAG: ATP-binding protein [Bacteroidales bacterium]|nr:ATP-binding protein [Bacteroidales bacterium]
MTKQEFDILIAQGEGQYIEFKERLDKSFAKEVCAFANASGGRIGLGIADDNTIKGISNSNHLKSKIQDLGSMMK